jgi:hypothetical protein
LEKIFTQIKLDGRFQLAFHLLHKTTHCEHRLCYSLPAFSHKNEKIQLSVLQSNLVLSPALYISCTLLANKRTSIFSHQIAVNRDGILHFQNNVLPSVPNKDLLNPNIVDLQSREIGKNDLIGGVLFPIYSNAKVSFQCDIAQTIQIDQLQTHCNQRSLHFVDFPTKISVNGKDILPGFKPHYFVNQKLKGNENSLLQTKISFISEQNTTHDLKDDVFAFFEQATPVQWSLIAICIVLFLTFVVICFLVSYFKKPLLCLKTIFICCRGNCVSRCFERKNENIKVTKSYKELLKNNVCQPSAPPGPMQAHRQPFLQPSAPLQPIICNQGFSGCPCGPASLHRCVGAQ